jgi:hypothetical protein
MSGTYNVEAFFAALPPGTKLSWVDDPDVPTISGHSDYLQRWLGVLPAGPTETIWGCDLKAPREDS